MQMIFDFSLVIKAENRNLFHIDSKLLFFFQM